MDRTRIALVSLVALCVGVLLVLAMMGRYAFVTKTALFPALVGAAWLSGRLKRWAADWAPFLAWVALFEALRGLTFAVINHFRMPVYTDYVIAADRAIFGEVGSVRLQQVFRSDWLDRALVVVHASHFVTFLLFGMAVWMLRHQEFKRFSRAMLLTMYVGLSGYLFLPTIPPWMADSHFHLIPKICAIPSMIYNTAVPQLQEALDVNPVAAMPSLHAAFPALCFLIAWRFIGHRAWPLAVYTAVMGFALVYLGAHYALDIFAGWALAGAAYWVVFHLKAFDGLHFPAKLRAIGGTDPAPIACLLVFALSEVAGGVTLALSKSPAL